MQLWDKVHLGGQSLFQAGEEKGKHVNTTVIERTRGGSAFSRGLFINTEVKL